jgi:hypothetical protein
MRELDAEQMRWVNYFGRIRAESTHMATAGEQDFFFFWMFNFLFFLDVRCRVVA